MRGCCVPDLVAAGLIAVAAASAPALADVLRIDQAGASGGTMVVTGHVSPPSTVTIEVGQTSIIVKSDPRGRFVWIGDQVPPSCTVAVVHGLQRARTPLPGCGLYPAAAAPATEYGSSATWRSDQPAPGIGGPLQTTTMTSETGSVVRTDPPWIISPNDPRYAHTEPYHWGAPEIQGQRSGEVRYGYPPERGFYANVRSKEGG